VALRRSWQSRYNGRALGFDLLDCFQTTADQSIPSLDAVESGCGRSGQINHAQASDSSQTTRLLISTRLLDAPLSRVKVLGMREFFGSLSLEGNSALSIRASFPPGWSRVQLWANAR
jgi:hypothetical protein